MNLLSWLWGASGFCASDDIQGLIAASGTGVSRTVYTSAPEWTKKAPGSAEDAQCLATYWLYVAKRRADAEDEHEAEKYLFKAAAYLGKAQPSYGALTYAIEQIEKSGLNAQDSDQITKILRRARTKVTARFVATYGFTLVAFSGVALYFRRRS